MRILIVNVNGRSGSTGAIVNGLYANLKYQGHDVKVCYRGALEPVVDNEDYYALCGKLSFSISVFLSRLTGLESHFSFFATKKLKRFVESFHPDVVQLYNIHGNYIRSYSFLYYLKKHNIPVVYSMVDEYPYMGKCPYPLDCTKYKTECNHCPQKKDYPDSWFFDTSRYLFRKKERIYKDFKHIVFTGPPFVCERAKDSRLLKDQNIEELYEPFNFKDHYYPRETARLRNELGISPEEKVILCASGTSPRKGGKYFIDIAQRLRSDTTLKFIFIGYNRKDWVFPDNVIVKGYIQDQSELAEFMSLADVYVCTSVGDTTPSVCLAALGCGTPLIGFDYGGVMDCAPNDYGTYVPIGDVDAMAIAVSNVKKKSVDDVDKIRDYAIGVFSYDAVFEKQLRIYKELIKETRIK